MSAAGKYYDMRKDEGNILEEEMGRRENMVRINCGVKATRCQYGSACRYIFDGNNGCKYLHYGRDVKVKQAETEDRRWKRASGSGGRR